MDDADLHRIDDPLFCYRSAIAQEYARGFCAGNYCGRSIRYFMDHKRTNALARRGALYEKRIAESKTEDPTKHSKILGR